MVADDKSAPSGDRPTHRFAVCGTVAVGIHLDGEADALIREMAVELPRLGSAVPTFGFLLALVEGARPPSEAMRKQAIEVFRAQRGRMRAAVIMEASGFWAAAVRASFTMIAAASSLPIKIFADAHDGVAWLEQHGVVKSVEPQELLAAVQRLRLPFERNSL